MMDLEIRERPKRRSESNGDARPTFVSAAQFARHIGCVRSYLDKLLDEKILERHHDGRFDLDRNRLRYIAHLKELRKRSPRSEADSAFVRAKAELINLRIQERKRILINAEKTYARVDRLIGMFLSGLASFAARCGGRDMQARQAIDKAVYDLRLEIAQAANRIADEEGEPKDVTGND